MIPLTRFEKVTPLKASRVYGKLPHLRVTCLDLWEFFSSVLEPSDGIYSIIYSKTQAFSHLKPSPYFIVNPHTDFGYNVVTFPSNVLFHVLAFCIIRDILYHPTVDTPLRFATYLPKKKKYKKSLLRKIPTFLASLNRKSQKQISPSSSLVILSTFHQVYQLQIRSPLIQILKVPSSLRFLSFLFQLKICSLLKPRAGVG